MKFYKNEILKIMGIAVLSAVLFNSFSSKGLAYVFTPVQLEDKRTVTLEEAKKLYEEEAVLFIDARPEAIFKRGHIPRAINIPYSSKEKEELLKDIPKDKSIVVYCYSSRCNQARILDENIRKLGYKNVVVFEGGVIEWTKAKYPFEKAETE